MSNPINNIRFFNGRWRQYFLRFYHTAISAARARLNSYHNLKIEYEVGSSGGSINENYDSSNPLMKKIFTFQSGGKGASIPLKDTVIKVKVIIDNDEQTLELKYVN